MATERMNKRVRDAAFKNLVVQEIGWFDVRTVGSITTQLSDDAALIHSFSGEPIRTMVMNLASVAVGLIVSFTFMWYVKSWKRDCFKHVQRNVSPSPFVTNRGFVALSGRFRY